MITVKYVPNEGWRKTPDKWRVLKKHVELLGGEAQITDTGLTVKASTAKRTRKDKDGETVEMPTLAEEIAGVLTQMYQWTVQDE